MSNVIHTGHGHFVAKDRVLAITSAKGGLLPNKAKLQMQDSDRQGKLIKHTNGRSIRSALHLDDGWMVVSSVEASTLAKRWED